MHLLPEMAMNFMKTPKYIIIALALGICSAGAITLTVHHDTQKKLDFTVDWHDPLGGDVIYSGFSQVTGDWEVFSSEGEDQAWIDFDIYAISPLFHDGENVFPQRGNLTLFYAFYPSSFGEINVQDAMRVNGPAMKLAHDLQSARFTFFEKDYLPVAVPDGGSTFLLLGMALGGLCLHRRRPTSQQP